MHPDIEVLGTYVNNSTPIAFKCNVDNNVWNTKPDYLMSGCGCPECGKRSLSRSKTNTKDHFVELVNKINPHLEITGDYKGLRFKIQCKCRECGYEFERGADKLANRKCRCPQCSGKVVIKGINDIGTTHPALAKYFKNIDESYKYRSNSKKKIWFKCPICGEEKQRQLNLVVSSGYHCPFCDSTVSLPNRVIRNLLRILNAENFEYEYSPAWAGNYWYDATFTKDGQRYIVEMDGEFHFKVVKNKGCSENDLIATQRRDKIKDNLAEQNHAILIRIDCTPCSMSNIIRSIVQSPLATLFDLSNIQWNDIQYMNDARLQIVCDAFNKHKSSATQISKILKIDRHDIINYLRRGVELGLCDYNAEEYKTKKVRKPIRSFNIATKEEIIHKSITDVLEYLRSLGIGTSFSTVSYHSKVSDNYQGFILSRV